MSLLVAVVAPLAEALQVRAIPELCRITAMRVFVVSHQLRRLGFDLAAHGAGERRFEQHLPPQLGPWLGVVPFPPVLRLVPHLPRIGRQTRHAITETVRRWWSKLFQPAQAVASLPAVQQAQSWMMGISVPVRLAACQAPQIANP